MATLNTLRTKFGIVLSAVIALALLAFIFSLGADMGFSSPQDPQVGEINGTAVSYSQYLEAYEEIRTTSGVTEIDQQTSDNLAQAAWNNLLNEVALIPGYQELGITMSDSERARVINGSIPTQSLYSFFADQSTGQYNLAAVSRFLIEGESNPQASQAWDSLLEAAQSERMSAKYIALISSAAYVTPLEVEAGVAEANSSFSGRWVGKRYSLLEDSDYTVSDKEVSDFYNKNKESRYKQNPTTTIQYVEFAIAPTADDELSIEREVREIATQFKAAENPRIFAREHTRGSVTNGYMASSQLREEESKVVFADEFYGPVKSNNVWVVSKGVNIISAPDSVGLRQAVLPYNQAALADSLFGALKVNPSMFSQVVAQYSVFSQSAQNGGDLGVMPLSALPLEFVAPIAAARRGEVVRIESGDYIQLLEVYHRGQELKHAQIVSIEYPVEASQSTIDATYSKASNFALMAKGSGENFKSAADSLHVLTLPVNISESDRRIPAIASSSEISSWANNAKAGDLSKIFKAGEGYIVALVTAKNSGKYISQSNMEGAIRAELLREKKFEALASELAAVTSLEQAASTLGVEVERFEAVKFADFYLQGLGVEPAVIGSITAASTTGALSSPVKGNSGVYMFVVDDIAASDTQSAAAQKVLLESSAEDNITQSAYAALIKLANIVDQRGKFF